MYAMLSLMMGLAYLNIGNQESKVVDRTSLLWYSAAFFVFMSQAAVGVCKLFSIFFVQDHLANLLSFFSLLVFISLLLSL